jgi:hypoxanthine phosphoribosyltransferase
MMLTDEMLRQIRDEAVMLHAPEAVAKALDRMAEEITAALDGALPIVLCVLTGGIIPTGRLLSRLAFPLETDYLHATRYRGKTRGDQEIVWLCKPHLPLQGRTVLLVDDILDEGHTLKAIIEYCQKAGAARVCTAVLVEKHHGRRVAGMRADFVGLAVEDRYVFGCGMDYKGYLRNLNGVFTLGERHARDVEGEGHA